HHEATQVIGVKYPGVSYPPSIRPLTLPSASVAPAACVAQVVLASERPSWLGQQLIDRAHRACRRNWQGRLPVQRVGQAGEGVVVQTSKVDLLPHRRPIPIRRLTSEQPRIGP